MSVGTMLCIDDIILTACCYPNLFVRPVDEEKESIYFAEPLHSLGDETQFAKRFFDYSALINDTEDAGPLAH